MYKIMYLSFIKLYLRHRQENTELRVSSLRRKHQIIEIALSVAKWELNFFAGFLKFGHNSYGS